LYVDNLKSPDSHVHCTEHVVEVLWTRRTVDTFAFITFYVIP